MSSSLMKLILTLPYSITNHFLPGHHHLFIRILFANEQSNTNANTSDLGLTFLEINDRAYVRKVDPNSAAANAGIQPEDCVQFACVVGGPQFDDQLTSLQHREEETTSRRGSGSKMVDRELNKERQLLDGKASQFAMECEKRGMRTSYEELRELFSGCTLAPKGDGEDVVLATPQRKTAPTPATPSSAKRSQIANQDDWTIDESTNSLLMADSVGGMFEAGKSKKKGISSRCVPSLPDNKAAKAVTQNVTSAARSAAGCFMGDEHDGDIADVDEGEFGGRRASRRNNERGSFFLDTPSTPIRSDIIAASSPRQSSRGAAGSSNFGDGLVEQELYPVVMVFRRTVQRKRILSPGKGWGSPGLSIRGSLFGIPSFRMDDECDRAATLIRQLAPSKKVDSTPFHDDENSTQPSVATSPDRGVLGGEDDIEASTIRGMIQNAVGLGFVRTSKVVVGVSLQAGSGIIIARLPDGTWSAPSAIGVYGLGVGMQFGLEVADYMFILQTREGVEHFRRGGNFAVGGNIGAAVANCGREAYGAASLGACTGSRNLDEQIQRGDSDDEGGGGSTVYDGSTNASSAQGRKQGKKKDNDIAPMVAYAKSQGLYFGVSVDGLKFFTRNDINSRAYKFSMLSEMAAKDILGGLVAPPTEAEDLYAALHR